jgi:ferredoxin
VDKKYQECVAVCPVEAFRELPTYLVIDPDECIDCGACIAECPVDAIFADTDVPTEEEAWIQRNEDESPGAEIAEGDSPVLADD